MDFFASLRCSDFGLSIHAIKTRTVLKPRLDSSALSRAGFRSLRICEGCVNLLSGAGEKAKCGGAGKLRPRQTPRQAETGLKKFRFPTRLLPRDKGAHFLFSESLKMTGFEVVGVVFGVLPVLIEVVKSYAKVTDKIRTFRHYSGEVKSIQAQLRVHKQNFHNECRLILRLVVEDDQKVKDMLDNASDGRWQSKELNDQLNHCLRENFELCNSIIEGSKVILEDLEVDLKKFDFFDEQKSKVDGRSIPCPASQF
jgi:hypothetical protein